MIYFFNKQARNYLLIFSSSFNAIFGHSSKMHGFNTVIRNFNIFRLNE